MRILGAAAAIAMGCLLTGCITLLPTPDPVRLYTFLDDLPGSPRRNESPVLVALSGVQFTRVGRTDRITTRSGSRVANIAGARWIAPADTLFVEGLSAAFDRTDASLTRNYRSLSAGVLSVRVETFETQYGATKGPPTIVVIAAVALNVRNDSSPRVQTFCASKSAAENRVGQIVRGYSDAVADVTAEIARWTSDQVELREPSLRQHPFAACAERDFWSTAS